MTMHIKRGIQVSPGVAIGRVVVLDAEVLPIPVRHVALADVERQKDRLHQALEESSKAITQLRDQTASRLGEELARIFDFHLGMLKDPHLVLQIEEMIERERVTAESAVYAVLRRQAQSYEQLQNRYISERVKDIDDLEHRIIEHLIGRTREELDHLKHEAILVAHDLAPSLTAGLDKKKIKAIVADLGGRTSHTAILAHALGIPAIVGMENLSAMVTSGDMVVVDGNRGLVVIDPDAAKLLEYREELERFARFEGALGELAELPCQTKDGTDITLQANIEFPSEIHTALDKGAVGIGLYRTEFLYLSVESEPSEQDHLAAYQEAIAALDGRPLTIRTLDLGADKLQVDDSYGHVERNPFLGCRSIRLCLQNLPLFKTQLRAILRASCDGPVRIMFPLISAVTELRQARMILNDVMEDLDEESIPYSRDIPVGIMIEVPSAALQAMTLAREVDFFSIGTNDLIQYTVAVDRGNERIASLYSAAHPAVLQLIKEVIRAAQRTKIDVSLCGEMAGEPEFVMLLVGMGLRGVSMTPPAIPEIKKVIRSVTIEHCKRIARKATSFESDRELINYLRNEVAKVIPEAFDERSITR